MLFLFFILVFFMQITMTNKIEDTFNQIYINNIWNGKESISGTGSDLVQTKTIRVALPILFKKFNVKTILDIPCGDFFWMQYVNLESINYLGMDIVKDLINKNNKNYTKKNIKFIHSDILLKVPQKVDLVLCRDLLVHFSYEDIFKALKNLKNSGSKYLLTTTFTNSERFNRDIKTGGWRTLSLQKKPFSFPKPILIINENCTEINGLFKDKSLALWRLSDIKF